MKSQIGCIIITLDGFILKARILMGSGSTYLFLILGHSRAPLFPLFWLHSEQSWLFITLNEDQSILTQSFDANTQVWTAFETP